MGCRGRGGGGVGIGGGERAEGGFHAVQQQHAGNQWLHWGLRVVGTVWLLGTVGSESTLDTFDVFLENIK